MRRCAVSVDLDEVHHYYQIHGLGAVSGVAAHAVYDIALERCLELGRELGVPLTLFAVSSDLARSENVAALRRALAAGHEVGNHSRDHLYELVRRSADEQRQQVLGAAREFESLLGVKPLGFRAPGYTVSDQLLEIVAEAGHRYDSSVFPCAPYYAAKVMAIGALRLRGRRSRAILDSPAVLSAPTRPYRLGRPYTSRGEGLWEFPIQVTPALRLPFIGTALTLAGKLGARALTELVIGEPFINLELHGIDLLDFDDGLRELIGYQPDVRVRIRDKRATLRAVIERLQRAGYRFVTLAQAADAA